MAKGRQGAKDEARRPWKGLLLEVDALLKDWRRYAYQIAVKLTAVWEESEFLADPSWRDEAEAVKVLDRRAEQLFVIVPGNRSPFHDLRAMLARFPDQKRWEHGNLSEMYDAVLAAGAEPVPATRKRRSVTVAEFDNLQDQCERLRKKGAVLESEKNRAERLGRELEEARVRIAELERENAELRRLLDEQLVPA